MNQSFTQFKLQQFLLEGLEKLGLSTPTAIQLQAIPALLKGKDLIGQSQTGTGKTLAYVLPILNFIETDRKELQALILVPTKELIRQVADTINDLTGSVDIDIVLLQGGEDINRQMQRLKRNPQVIVGTPGRVRDLIKREAIAPFTTRQLVIDEADTMLAMGFREDIEEILQNMKKQLQIILFAATLPQKVRALAKAAMREPVIIEVNPGERTIPGIENIYFKVRAGGKEAALVQLVKLYNPYLGIVFARKKEHVDDLVAELRQAGFKTEGLHGDMQRGQRKQVMQRFAEARSQLLVATDIASRGLDIEGVTHIFNFDLPINVDQYIHRIGRTGRAGEKGVAINLILSFEEEKLKGIAEKVGRPFKEKMLSGGEIVEKGTGRKNDFEEEENRKGVDGEDQKAGKMAKSPKAQKKKFTGPNARKRAIKEFQLKKKQETKERQKTKNRGPEQKKTASGKSRADVTRSR